MDGNILTMNKRDDNNITLCLYSTVLMVVLFIIESNKTQHI